MYLSTHKTLILRLVVIVLAGALVFGWFGGRTSGGQSRPEDQSVDATATPAPASDLNAATPLPGAAVEVGGEVIFYVRERIGSLTPAGRAALISKRLHDLSTNPFAPPVELHLAESTDGIDINEPERLQHLLPAQLFDEKPGTYAPTLLGAAPQRPGGYEPPYFRIKDV